MGFFFRKSISMGPLRLNFSKKGVGMSVGVRGARIGTGPRGAYIAGGRGGLYFRKNISSQKVSNNFSNPSDDNFSHLTGLPDDKTLVNTDVTYPSNIKKTDISIEPPPQFPSSTRGEGKYFLSGLGLLIFSRVITSNHPFYAVILGLFLIGIGITKLFKNHTIKKQIDLTKESINEYSLALSKDENIEKFLNLSKLNDIQESIKRVYSYQLLYKFIDSKIVQKGEMDESVILTIETIKEKLNISDKTFRAIKIIIFRDMFDSFMEDEHLEEQEEQTLNDFASKLDLAEDDTVEERESIRAMSQIRKELEEELLPMQTDAKLQKSEVCFYSSIARKLNEKILQTRTINGIRHKTMGLVTEREGQVYLTNKRILLIGSGTSTIKIEKILDIIVTPSNNLVELTVDGRKKPVYFTVPNAVTFGARIEKLKGE